MCKRLDDSTHSVTSAVAPTVDSKSEANSEEAPIMNKPLSKSVSFQTVEIAQYPMELGDNPAAEGLPLSISWVYDSKTKLNFDEYEDSKPLPRSREEFWMPPRYREAILSGQGVTASEMRRTTNEMKRIKKSRQRSIKNKKWDKVNMFVEESQRKLKHITSLKKLSSSSSSSSLMAMEEEKKMSKSKSSPSLSLNFGRKKKPAFDPLDDSSSRRKTMALHLLHHPEELLREEDEEEQTEELSNDTVQVGNDHTVAAEDDAVFF